MKMWIAAAVATVCTAGAAQGKEFQFGSWAPPQHGVHIQGLQPLFKELEAKTSGAMTWKLIMGGQLASPRNTIPSLRDSVIDAGMVIPSLYQKELAHNNVVYNLQAFGTDTVAIAGATLETLMLNCPECLAEYKAQGAVYAAGYGITPYRLQCNKPMTSVEDAKGLKVFATGGAVRLMKAIGAVPVAMSPTESITALQRGGLDCAHGPHAWIRFNGFDVIKSVIDYPLGSARGFGMMVMSRATWDSLPPDQKKLLWELLPRAIALAVIKGQIAEDQVVKKEAMEKHNIKFIDPGNAWDPIIASFAADEKKTVAEDAKKLGVKNPEALIDKHLELIRKWEGLAKDIGGDPDKFAAALQSEIYAKIDPLKI
jgi:TRAP-type C4-dicarboxylate transport system substrate-binding protein